MSGIIGLAVLAWAVGLWLLLIVAAVEIAEAKGRNGTNWGWLAFFYGVFALIAIALLPPRRY